MPLSSTKQRHLLPLLGFFGGSFFLHLLWENLQSPLYTCFWENSFVRCFLICLRATVTGDMLFMLTIYAALAMVHRDWLWVSNAATFRHPATWLIAVLIGVLLAVSFELWAVHVAERWQYTSVMPLIPIVQVGLTPVLQMILVPLGVLFITSRVSTRHL